MKESIIDLLNLQTIDKKLDNIELAKGNLPEKVKKAELELEAARNELSQNKLNLEELQKELRKIESDVAILAENKKKYDEQLYAVQTNKEYDAVTLEIDTTITKIDDLENREIELLDEEKEAIESVKDATEKLEKTEENFEKTSIKLKKTIEANADKEKELTQERKDVSQKIRIDFLRLYERIRKPKGGIPLVTIDRGSCGGCYTNIPPQRIIEVREADRLIVCEHCGRILYWQDEEELTIK
ncbi:MAG: hypothetical protein DWQ05_11935 [Calditrichaeota bacterium]|nr:MAG: hypothetical protein DWQ05_11935 [Calditrichota bacterium]